MNRRITKRNFAITLVFAMIMSLFMGVRARADEADNELPRVGIYSADAVSESVLLGKEICYLEDEYSETDFYILVKDETDDSDNPTVTRSVTGYKIYEENRDITGEQNYVTLTDLGNEKGYKVTINEGVSGWFRIALLFNETDNSELQEEEVAFNGSEGGPEEVVEDGLVIGSPYGENGISFEGGDFHNSFDISIKDDNLVLLGIKEGEDIAQISHDDLDKLSFTDEEGNAVSGASITKGYYWDEEGQEDVTEDGFYNICIENLGSYILTYKVDDTTSYEVSLDADMPNIAAYNSETVSEDTLIGRKVVYNSAERTYYINKCDKSGDGWGPTYTINGYRIESDSLPEDYLKDMIAVEPTDEGYKVTIADDRQIWFSIAVEFTETNYWDEEGERQEDSWESEEWIDFSPDKDEDLEGGLWLDGAPQAGFSGCYISEDSYKYGVYNAAVDGNQYWVHAATIQEVIDKLSEVAIGDTVPGYVIDFESGTIKLDKDTKVTNTGYISIAPSQYGDKELAPQYIASSGNLHGISFGNSTYAYYIKEDEEGIYNELTGMSGAAGDYIELGVDDPIRFLEFERGNLTPEQTAVFEDLVAAGDGLIEYKGVFYRAERHDNHYTNRDGIEIDDSYFTFASAEPLLQFDSDAAHDSFMEIYNDFLDKYAEYLDETGSAANEYRRGDIMPGIHVNLYCDMQFSGDMGNLIIGYPDKSLTGGKQYEATIDGSDVEITGPDSYPDDTLITSDGGPFGRSQYNLRTYAINSELDVKGTASGVSAVVPEPNALSEMSYAQKDAIEAGAKLTVDVTANDVDAGGTLDAETKDAVDAIVDATGKSANSMEFIDFNIDASVTGVAGSTKITETVVPMMITIKPKKAIDKNSKYRIARFHKGTVDYIDIVDSLYGDVAGLNMGFIINDDGTITFLADKFSVYAIENVSDEGNVKTSDGTVSSSGIYVIQDSPSIVAGLVHEKSNASDDLEFRWIACDTSNGAWFEISPWTKNNEWINWTPKQAGNYLINCYVRVVGNEEESMIYKTVGVSFSKHAIKGICQMPYEGGYLIGIESYENPNQSYQYEMLIMDLSIFASGNPNCWVHAVRCGVPEGNALWTLWEPQYGYYLTLFRVYDGEGNMLDQCVYGFANAY